MRAADKLESSRRKVFFDLDLTVEFDFVLVVGWDIK